MHALQHDPPVEIRLSEAEVIALAYHRAAKGDPSAALAQAIDEALTDLGEAEERLVEQRRLISYGYARCRVGAP